MNTLKGGGYEKKHWNHFQNGLSFLEQWAATSQTPVLSQTHLTVDEGTEVTIDINSCR